MHARYFSAHLGTFHSVDTVGGASDLPQSWNRYAYVLGNPLQYVDPFGLQSAAFGDEITVTGQLLPLGSIPLPQAFFNFLMFGNFLRHLSQIKSPPDFLTLHQRADVQHFFACLGKRASWGAPNGEEVGGFALFNQAGDLDLMARRGTCHAVTLGVPPSNAVLGAHVHPRTGPTGFVPGGADVRYANVHKGLGGQRIPHFIIHAGTGVTRYLLGVDQPPGTVVLNPGFQRDLSNVCANVGSF